MQQRLLLIANKAPINLNQRKKNQIKTWWWWWWCWQSTYKYRRPLFRPRILSTHRLPRRDDPFQLFARLETSSSTRPNVAYGFEKTGNRTLFLWKHPTHTYMSCQNLFFGIFYYAIIITTLRNPSHPFLVCFAPTTQKSRSQPASLRMYHMYDMIHHRQYHTIYEGVCMID